MEYPQKITCTYTEYCLSLVTQRWGKQIVKHVFNTSLAWQRSFTVRIPMVHLVLLYVSLFMRKQDVKFCPAVDRLSL